MKLTFLLLLLLPFSSHSQCNIGVKILNNPNINAFQILEYVRGTVIQSSQSGTWIQRLEIRECYSEPKYTIVMYTDKYEYFFHAPRKAEGEAWLNAENQGSYYQQNIKDNPNWIVEELYQERSRCNFYRSSGRCERYTYNPFNRCWQHEN